MIGCTRYQLAEWLKRKDELTSLQSLNRGEWPLGKGCLFSMDIRQTFYGLIGVWLCSRWTTQAAQRCGKEDEIRWIRWPSHQMVQWTSNASFFSSHSISGSRQESVFKTIGSARNKVFYGTETRTTIVQVIPKIHGQASFIIAKSEEKPKDILARSSSTCHTLLQLPMSVHNVGSQ